jgi:hypothetical protein
MEASDQLRASFSFFKHESKFESEKPYYVSGDLPEHLSAVRSNYGYEICSNIPVEDIRDHEGDFRLEDYGFQVFRLPDHFKINQLEQEDRRLGYLDDLVSYITTLLAAEVVVCYDYRVRVPSSLRFYVLRCPSRILISTVSPKSCRVRPVEYRGFKHHITAG